MPCDTSLVVVIRDNHRGWHVQLVGVVGTLALSI